MAKQIVTDSIENQKKFVLALQEYKNRIQTLGEKAYLAEWVDSSHPLYNEMLKFIAVQNSSQDNMVTKKDISDEDYAKLNNYAKRRRMSLEDLLSSLAKNLRYVARGKSHDFISRLQSLSLDIRSVFEEYYHKREQFPINVLKKENYNFLINLENGLSTNKNLELILRVMHPDLISEKEPFNTTSKAIRLERDKTQVLEYANIVRTKYADENGNLDSLFAEKNEKFFIELVRFLDGQWISFEEFVNKYVQTKDKKYDYTHCYTADSTKVGPLLIDYYVGRFGTTRQIQDTDPYLATKLRSAMDALNIHETKKLINYWDRPSDNEVNDNMLSEEELQKREDRMIITIKRRYGGVVPDKLKDIDRNLYELIKLLSKRRGFGDIDKYLSSIGIARQKPVSTGTSKKVNFFTDYDFQYYQIFDGVGEAGIEEFMKYLDIRLIPADERHIKTYRNLAYGKQDVRAYNLDTRSPKKY